MPYQTFGQFVIQCSFYYAGGPFPFAYFYQNSVRPSYLVFHETSGFTLYDYCLLFSADVPAHYLANRAFFDWVAQRQRSKVVYSHQVLGRLGHGIRI